MRPDPVEKPTSAYALFMKSLRDNEEFINSLADKKDFMKKASEKWNSSDDEKRPFLREHEQQKQAYDDYVRQLNEYKRLRHQDEGESEDEVPFEEELNMKRKSSLTLTFV